MTDLHNYKNQFNERGELTPEGHETYQNIFTGGAYFSDSSDTEKE